MRNAILNWYAYSEAGAAAGRNQAGTALAGTPDSGVLSATGRAASDEVANLFANARLLDQRVSAAGWMHLFGHYGLVGLIDLAKRREVWPADTRDATIADAIMSEARDAGYEPESTTKIERGREPVAAVLDAFRAARGEAHRRNTKVPVRRRQETPSRCPQVAT